MTHEKWSEQPDRERMARLARTFPTLARDAPIDVFDPEALDAWVCSGTAISGTSAAARFVLSVWSAGGAWCWKSHPFELHEALLCWDDEHRAAFLAWVREPWWP